jgi:hypothetical protein
MSEFISCDAHPLQGSKQLLILDQALHHSLNGSIGFVVMIDLHEDYKVLEDHVDNHKMVGVMCKLRRPLSLCVFGAPISGLRTMPLIFLAACPLKTAFFLVSLENCFSKWLVVRENISFFWIRDLLTAGSTGKLPALRHP